MRYRYPAGFIIYRELKHPGGGTAHMKVVRMLVGNFELNPQKRPIWAWPKLFLFPKRGHVKTQTNEKTWII